MRDFDFSRAKNVDGALEGLARGQRLLAGGTTLVDLMKLEVETPAFLLDGSSLSLNEIEELKGGGLRIGAFVSNTALAHHRTVARRYAVLSQAILAGASTQLRNKATTGGNLLQRTRCVYFRDTAKPCNKREPGSGCPAIEGHNRNLAILGTSESCIANNPSDMNVALRALEAKVHVTSSARGERVIPIEDFHLLPGKTPHIETSLKSDELITHVTLPDMPEENTSLYLKLRDRASYEFALASAAVVARATNGKIAGVSLAMGGVGTKPWRVPEAEDMLIGEAPSERLFRSTAEVFLKDAKAYSENGFKVELAQLCLVRALSRAFAPRRTK